MTTAEINLLQDRFEEVESSIEELALEGRLEEKDRLEIKRIVEALLFSATEPISLKKLREVVSDHLPIPNRSLHTLLGEMKEEYQRERRGFQIDEVAGGYLLRTHREYAHYIHRLHVGRRGERLSQAATEVLAIIAYRQPITRSEIDQLRGVDSSGAIQSLVERGVVEVKGRSEKVGKPPLYGTTSKFLHHFGLRKLSELPSL